MESHLQPEPLLRHIYGLYRSGDLSGFPAIVSPDCEWVFPGNPEILPWAGTYRGLGIFDFAAKIAGSIAYEHFEDHTYLPSGDSVVVVLRERCRVLSTGKVFHNDIAAVATVRAGLLVRYVEYSDTGAMERAFAK
jgi:ketosteroid isomerase-like protein